MQFVQQDQVEETLTFKLLYSPLVVLYVLLYNTFHHNRFKDGVNIL